MNFFAVFMAFFSVLGAIDRIIGNRFGLGEQFEKGFHLFGISALSMIGMIILAPLLAQFMDPVLRLMGSLRLEPSILPATLFANDMGGAALSYQVAADPALGRFNALVVSSMMGVTISFTVPVALTMVKAEQHKNTLLGFLCGVITVPLGCFVGGLLMGIAPMTVLWDLLPLLVFSALICCCLLFWPTATVKVFQIFGTAIGVLITIGLAIGVVEFLTGLTPLKGLDTLENGAAICLNASVVASGAFPFMHILSKLLDKPLKWLGKAMGINQVSALGFVSTIATSVTTYGMMGVMDAKGVVLNSAFAISAAFTLAGHLAFTMAMDASAIAPMIAGKLFAGVLAVVLATFIYKRGERKQTAANT